jgi:hypothetical protein
VTEEKAWRSALMALGRLGEAGYAARRRYRWCSPPTSGIAMSGPTPGRWMGLTSGASFSSER